MRRVVVIRCVVQGNVGGTRRHCGTTTPTPTPPTDLFRNTRLRHKAAPLLAYGIAPSAIVGSEAELRAACNAFATAARNDTQYTPPPPPERHAPFVAHLSRSCVLKQHSLDTATAAALCEALHAANTPPSKPILKTLLAVLLSLERRGFSGASHVRDVAVIASYLVEVVRLYASRWTALLKAEETEAVTLYLALEVKAVEYLREGEGAEGGVVFSPSALVVIQSAVMLLQRPLGSAYRTPVLQMLAAGTPTSFLSFTENEFCAVFDLLRMGLLHTCPFSIQLEVSDGFARLVSRLGCAVRLQSVSTWTAYLCALRRDIRSRHPLRLYLQALTAYFTSIPSPASATITSTSSLHTMLLLRDGAPLLHRVCVHFGQLLNTPPLPPNLAMYGTLSHLFALIGPLGIPGYTAMFHAMRGCSDYKILQHCHSAVLAGLPLEEIPGEVYGLVEKMVRAGEGGVWVKLLEIAEERAKEDRERSWDGVGVGEAGTALCTAAIRGGGHTLTADVAAPLKALQEALDSCNHLPTDDHITFSQCLRLLSKRTTFEHPISSLASILTTSGRLITDNIPQHRVKASHRCSTDAILWLKLLLRVAKHYRKKTEIAALSEVASHEKALWGFILPRGEVNSFFEGKLNLKYDVLQIAIGRLGYSFGAASEGDIIEVVTTVVSTLLPSISEEEVVAHCERLPPIAKKLSVLLTKRHPKILALSEDFARNVITAEHSSYSLHIEVLGIMGTKGSVFSAKKRGYNVNMMIGKYIAALSRFQEKGEVVSIEVFRGLQRINIVCNTVRGGPSVKRLAHRTALRLLHDNHDHGSIAKIYILEVLIPLMDVPHREEVFAIIAPKLVQTMAMPSLSQKAVVHVLSGFVSLNMTVESDVHGVLYAGALRLVNAPDEEVPEVRNDVSYLRAINTFVAASLAHPVLYERLEGMYLKQTERTDAAYLDPVFLTMEYKRLSVTSSRLPGVLEGSVSGGADSGNEEEDVHGDRQGSK